MKIIKKDNISTVIIFSSMFIISMLVIFISYFFISKQYDILDREIKDTRENFIDLQKKEIKREVDSVVEYIKYKKSLKNYNEKNLKSEVKNWVQHIKFGDDKNNYIFIYKIINYKGGKNFAKMLLNPNRKDLEGKFISDDYKDENGKEFRKIFLKDIRKQGFSFVTYMYKKPNSFSIRPKISYFKLYKDWDWVIAAGTYLDNIDTNIAQKKEDLKRKMTLDITSSIVIFLFFSLIANIFAIILGKQIDKFFKEYNKEILNKTAELEELNSTLEIRVKDEVQKRAEQERLLIEKSKFIALGEMISNIAHQWRQPLSELSAIILNIKFRYMMKKLDDKTMSQKSKDAEKLLDYMSNTIDDFRNFFMPDKSKKKFSIKESLSDVLNITGKTLHNLQIDLNIDIDEEIEILGYKNEFEQVILNILSNAKDILIENRVKNPLINISTNRKNGWIKIHIDDNGGGIKIKPISKIFEPYISTKEESNGTGIGLYMSKIIIEKNMQGKIVAKNYENGARFTISLRIS
ncbi:MAG: cache domain-containing protein [Sulfurospirillum sp.]